MTSQSQRPQPPNPTNDFPFRMGFGYDVHRLVAGRRLILGGVEVPFDKGLEGHSDADVLLHALMDALLGAAALGDIGTHFPSSDPTLEGISSLDMLSRTMALLKQDGWHIANVDATIVAQQPRLSPHTPAMKTVIANALGIAQDAVNIKGKTTDGLGFTGTGDGMAAYCVVLVYQGSRGMSEAGGGRGSEGAPDRTPDHQP